MGNNLRTKIILSDKQEFKNIFNLFYPALCLFAYTFVRDNFHAEDIVQEVFLKLWEKSDDFNNIHAIKSFLYTSVKNKCINHLEHEEVIRKNRNYMQHILSDATINNQIVEEETHRLIYNAIDKLPTECKNILLLSINGLKNKEIAEELNISVNTVKTQKRIAYKQLKIKLNGIYQVIGLLLSSII